MKIWRGKMFKYQKKVGLIYSLACLVALIGAANTAIAGSVPIKEVTGGGSTGRAPSSLSWSLASGSSLVFNLGSVQEVGLFQAVLTVKKSAFTYNVDISSDAKTWTSIASNISRSGDSLIAVALGNQKAQYIRLTVNGAAVKVGTVGIFAPFGSTTTNITQTIEGEATGVTGVCTCVDDGAGNEPCDDITTRANPKGDPNLPSVAPGDCGGTAAEGTVASSSSGTSTSTSTTSESSSSGGKDDDDSESSSSGGKDDDDSESSSSGGKDDDKK